MKERVALTDEETERVSGGTVEIGTAEVRFTELDEVYDLTLPAGVRRSDVINCRNNIVDDINNQSKSEAELEELCKKAFITNGWIDA